MSCGRLAIVLVGTAALALSGGCGKLLGGGSPTSPSGGGGGGGGTPPAFAVDDGVRFNGVHPAPLVVDGVTRIYFRAQSGGFNSIVSGIVRF